MGLGFHPNLNGLGSHSVTAGVVLDTPLRAVNARNALSKFLLVFSLSKNVKFRSFLGGLHFQFALNSVKYAAFCSYRTHALPFQNLPWTGSSISCLWSYLKPQVSGPTQTSRILGLRSWVSKVPCLGSHYIWFLTGRLWCICLWSSRVFETQPRGVAWTQEKIEDGDIRCKLSILDIWGGPGYASHRHFLKIYYSTSTKCQNYVFCIGSK